MASASYQDLGGGRWRQRWRERKDPLRKDSGWRDCERVIRGSEVDAEEYRLVIIRDLEASGHHDPIAHEVRQALPANLLDGLLAWVDAAELDGLRATSAKQYRAVIVRLVGEVHGVTGIPENEPLPVTLLSRRLFDQLKPVLVKRGSAVPPRYLRVLWQGWGWLADDPGGWPQIPRRPSTIRGFVPPDPIYTRTEAPTLEEADACLRHLRELGERAWGKSWASTFMGAIFMRFTGLRVGQVRGIHREDIDLKRGTLLVRVGKSRQEQAEQRVVPLSRHLLADPLFLDYFAAAPEQGPIMPRVAVATVRRAWEAATKAGEVRAYTWNPPQRKNSRPDHGFRAAFQAHLVDSEVKSDVIDFLVGHAGDGHHVRQTHYGRTLLEPSRAAVDGLGAVNWIGPEPTADNVVPLRAKEGAG